MSREDSEGKVKTFLEGYDCEAGKNCYLQRHLMDYKPLSDLLPSNNGFTDIDGVLEMDDGKVLFLEVKRGSAELKPIQKILHKNLSRKDRQSTLVVWRDKDGEPTRCQWITRGEERDVIELPGGMSDLTKVVHTWISM